ncbi:MAG: AAA family ATPase, partial [Patescibacteria group bacterium]
MYLKDLSLQGFKTFARKTTLSFLEPVPDRQGVTAIVGPNGSGKSNIADALRWVLGEQSMKSLRSASSHDVIFSGGGGKTRAGFAEVTATFGNTGHIEGIESAELSLTRRLYRDGESQYLMNGQTVRLADIHMLLAQANVGQKSYAIINQGSIDHILSSTPEERKAFFDDATGVKPLQLKRHKALLKIERSRENLSQAEWLLEEIAPRLRTLKRLVRRLSQREEIEQQLKEKHIQYYGALWNTLAEQVTTELSVFKTHEKAVKEQTATLGKERAAFKKMEQAEAPSFKSEDGGRMAALPLEYETLQGQRDDVRERRFAIEKEIELARAKSVSHWAPLPLAKIIEHARKIAELVTGLKKKIGSGAVTTNDINELADASSTLVTRLQKPAPQEPKPDPEKKKALEQLGKEDAALVKEIETVKERMQSLASASKEERQELFALQRRLLTAQEALHDAETRLNERRVALARLETRREDLEKEMTEAIGELARDAKASTKGADLEALYPEIQQLRHTLDLIGGIDEETVAEYKEAQERHDFLDGQIMDLVQALTDTEKIIRELDEQIKKTSSQSFKNIQRHFEHYFKLLFRGGSASLEEIRAADLVNDESSDASDSQNLIANNYKP